MGAICLFYNGIKTLKNDKLGQLLYFCNNYNPMLGVALFSLFSNSLNRRKNFAVCLYIIGIIAMATFIIGLGLYLASPMRTMGEIRLWYAFLLGIVGLIIYLRWNFSWILLFTSVLSSVFLIINLIRPELHNQTLMPALQSIWFVPHVIIYMSSYALLGGSFFIALYGLMKKNTNYLHACDQLVIAGTAFFTLAMLIGSLWAKAAWGIIDMGRQRIMGCHYMDDVFVFIFI